ncbi:sporulation and spore germination protein [Kineococcus xinjiangensis]|uniref:Sporulation and spore germination protein n=1 Tax=Kineococcus xinjiangensis TaxID=512762 RepID=A0A2S6IFD0_9ACTN|nr:GerMN domain-containing protein [Kineococcus xinjiangensis]PPK92924.1 sporulation and spore germination protein [Kineococcus xinjiangensis]
MATLSVRRARVLPAVGLCTLLLTTATTCGIPPQERPVPLPRQSAPDLPTVGEPRRGAMVMSAYFVRDGRLVPVRRELAEATPQAALEALVAGPTGAEAASGIRTALAPQRLEVLARDGVSPETVVVQADGELASVSGGDQLLAVAQLVWTATELPATRRVRVVVDGAAVEVPTDAGLARTAVGREDYDTVAPPPKTSAPSKPPKPPKPSEPAPSEPAPLEPAPLEPAPLEPAPLEPAPLEPAPLEPAPLEPAPLEPAPLEPVPAEPVPSDADAGPAAPVVVPLPAGRDAGGDDGEG